MINLIKLAPKQEQLDAHIRKKQGLEDQDLLLNTIFALQVEVAELANEVRFFKHWSADQEPRVKVEKDCIYCLGTGDENAEASHEMELEGYSPFPFKKCESCNGTGKGPSVNPALEEYADCLHFFLSIGNQAQVDWSEIAAQNNSGMDMQECFGLLNVCLVDMWRYEKYSSLPRGTRMPNVLKDTFALLWQIAQLLNFTAEDIEAAYLAKHEVNYERQAKGY